MTGVIPQLLVEYDRALQHTWTLVGDLDDDQVIWRPHEASSSIAWHLAHQGAVAHYLVRNLISAEARLEPALEALADSATAETERGALPTIEVIHRFRGEVADRVRSLLGSVEEGMGDAPDQLRLIGATVLQAIVNHEYQHSQWIGEVRSDDLGKGLPPLPVVGLVERIDGYPVVRLPG